MDRVINVFELGKMQPVNYSKFSTNLLAVCELSGITDFAISETCGVEIDEIKQWRKGKCIPLDTVNKIAKLAGVRIETVF